MSQNNNIIASRHEEMSIAYDNLYPSQVLKSTSDQYEIIEFLGSGSFGKVLKCFKKYSNEFVAVKILSSDPSYAELGRREMSTLANISQVNTEKYCFVRTIEFFMYGNHICLAFEMLEQSLSDFLSYNQLSAENVSYILKQLLTGLSKLKQLDIIHTDLKPENIMVVDPTRSPHNIKIIDFGCALTTREAVCTEHIQTRWYRAPEVLLGSRYGPAIDMWSLGCVAAEFYLRSPLYPGYHEFDQIRYICETQGLPPQSLLNLGLNTFLHFKLDLEKDEWSLKSIKEFEAWSSDKCREFRKHKLICLKDISNVNLPTRLNGNELLKEKIGRNHLVELIVEMLQLDPSKRITPEVALNHPAICELTRF